MTTTITGPAARFAADVSVPGDKSLSHRALIFAAMAEGRSSATGLAPGGDVASTAAALRLLGVTVTDDGVIDSPGVGHWTEPPAAIDVSNSGTTMRLLAGALAGRPFSSTLIGDASLMKRPMRRLVAPLSELGAAIAVSAGGTAPVTVGGTPLRGAKVQIGVASAQVRSAVALAALQGFGPTTIDSPPGFRDHTERALVAMHRGAWESRTAFRIDPGPLPATEWQVPGDPSSAAFLLASAALRDGSRVTARGIALNPGRIGFLAVLEDMGAEIHGTVTGDSTGEPVGDVRVTGGGLRGTTISGELTVRCLDELPLLALLAATADGPTTISDAAELRAKESDRIASTVALIEHLGGIAEPTEDGLVIEGGARLQPGRVDAAGDHRIAMAAAVGATTAGTVEIDGFEASAVSWPGFAEALERVWSSLP